MEIRIRERLVGALVLVGVVVLIVPALLKGPGHRPEQPPAGGRSVEILLDETTPPEGAEKLVPEPEIAREAGPVAPDGSAPMTAQKTERPAARAAATPGATAAPPAATAGSATSKVAGDAPASLTPAWAVQLGAFSSRAKADQLVASLRARGYAAFVLEYRADGRLLHRVRVGPEQDRARAAAIAERLRKDGFKPLVAPHP